MAYAGDLTPNQAFDLLQTQGDAVLVDVRSEAEWTFVGIPAVTSARFVEWTAWPTGARNPDFVTQASAGVEPGTPILCLCRSGVRSMAAAQALTDAGHTAYNVLEGFEGNHNETGQRDGGWRGAGLPWLHR